MSPGAIDDISRHVSPHKEVQVTVRKSLITWPVLALTIGLFAMKCVDAEIYINELMFNAGGGGSDATDLYVELRGTPSMSLADHYLIFLENEDTEMFDGQAGEIDLYFDFNIACDGGPCLLGSNGFLTVRQKNSPYPAPPAGTTDLINTGPDSVFGPFTFPPGFGSGENSTIGAFDRPTMAGRPPEGEFEGAGFTSMLLRNDSGPVPVLGMDLDFAVDNDENPATLNDGLDHPMGQDGWTILDAIGVFGEEGEAEFGRLYAQVNFGPEPTVNLEPDAVLFQTTWPDQEIEYLGRWGNSTGQTPGDWHASNITDTSSAGSDGVPDWRQSRSGTHPSKLPDEPPSQPIDPNVLESSQGVPYGVKITNTLGAPNFLQGDYDKDGFVTAADYVAWRNSVGATGTDAVQPPADGNHDYVVDAEDYAIWLARYAQPPTPEPGSGAARAMVPEGGTAQLLVSAFASLLTSIRQRKRSGFVSLSRRRQPTGLP
jgi:hypothetical protein